MWQPCASLSTLQFRALMYTQIRDFFKARQVLEIETPLLSAAGNPDPALMSFQTRFHGPGVQYLHDFYLNTSPEFAMKRMLAAGYGAMYSLGKVFRDGEVSQRHNPEFTLLEWYQLDYSLMQMVDETCLLINTLQNLIDESVLPVVKIRYRDLIHTMLGIDPLSASLETLCTVLTVENIQLSFMPQSRDEVLDILMSHLIEPRIPNAQLTVIYHYPASQASLARIIMEDGAAVGERFEVYWRGLELANGFHELADPHEQAQRFADHNLQRQQNGLSELPIDQLFLQALPQLPDCSGVAMGVDRLLMCLLGHSDINTVLSFGIQHA